MENRPIFKDRYQLDKKLGEGGMGEVYLAMDLQENEPVAIKTISQGLYSQESIQQRFDREAAVLRRLDHPNIVKYIDSFVARNRACLVMEYISGGTLDQLMKDREAFDAVFFQQMATKIIDGLSVAHEAGIVHRDLKPSNILLTAALEPVIADFGLAKVSDLSTLTSSGTMMGTILYMPPEAFDPQRKIDHRSDIWSLGVIFFQMLAGVLPFRGEMQTQVIGAILNGRPSSLKLYRPDLPVAWEMMIHQCLEKNPDNRYQSVRDMMSDLNNLSRVRHQPVNTNRDAADYEFPFMDAATVVDQPIHRPRSEFDATNRIVQPNLIEQEEYVGRWAPKEGAKNTTSIEMLIFSTVLVWFGIIAMFSGAVISILSITDFRDKIGVSDEALQAILLGGSVLFLIGVTFEAIAAAKYRYSLVGLGGVAIVVWLMFFSGLWVPEDLKIFGSILGTMMYSVVLLGYFHIRGS